MLGLVGRDVGALGALYDRYSTLVYSVSLRVLADRGLAEDVVQEVFLQLWRRPASYDAARGRFVSWLMSVTRNRAIDEQRRRSRRMRLEDPDEGASEQIRAEGRTSDPQLEAVLGEERQAVRAAIEELPPEQRRVLQLAYFGGLTQTEIAHYTGEPLGTVKTRVRLGMQKLRLSLSGTWQARRGEDDQDVRTGRGGS
jgi:RNA polymerase sigma-70 factor (ECF subfamily)